MDVLVIIPSDGRGAEGNGFPHGIETIPDIAENEALVRGANGVDIDPLDRDFRVFPFRHAEGETGDGRIRRPLAVQGFPVHRDRLEAAGGREKALNVDEDRLAGSGSQG